MRHHIDITVNWSDIDAYQHVNNSIYLRWLESARIDFASMHLSKTCQFIVAKIEITYLKPVYFPDLVRCESFIRKLGNSSTTMHTDVFSKQQQTLVASCDVVLVHFDYAQKKSIPWPNAIREQLRAFSVQDGS